MDVVIHSDSSPVSSYPNQITLYFTCLLVIDFRIYYPRNFIFGFSVNYDWSRGQLYSLGESVGSGRFQHEHMEDWVDRAHGLRKTESK